MDVKRPRLDDVLDVLRTHADELRGLGVAHAGVFGSLARGEAGSGSDVDVLVSFDESAEIDLFDFSEISARLRDWTGSPIDLAVKEKLKDHVRPTALRDAVNAF